MRKQYVVMAAALLAAMGAAKADVSITQQLLGKSSLVDMDGESSVKIKGKRQRTEQMLKGKPLVSILDVDGRRIILVDDKKQSATITPLQAVGAGLREVTTKPVEATVTKTSQQKTVASYPCTVHNIRISWPVDLSGGEGALNVTFVASGTACLSTAVPGYDEYRAFYTAAADAGAIFGDPALAKTPAGAAQAKAFAALWRKMAEAGMNLESRISVSTDGSGPLAGMMGSLGGDMRTTVTSVTTADLPAEAFDVPAGYKVKTTK